MVSCWENQRSATEMGVGAATLVRGHAVVPQQAVESQHYSPTGRVVRRCLRFTCGLGSAAELAHGLKCDSACDAVPSAEVVCCTPHHLHVPARHRIQRRSRVSQFSCTNRGSGHNSPASILTPHLESFTSLANGKAHPRLDQLSGQGSQ